MKKRFRILFFFCVSLFFINQISFAQKTKRDSLEEVTTVGTFNTEETKSGYIINEYFVELSKNMVDSLKGKKVIVTGKLLIVKGINPNDSTIFQGSLNDRKFIIEPRITIINESK